MLRTSTPTPSCHHSDDDEQRSGSRRRSEAPTSRGSGAYTSLSHITPFAFFPSSDPPPRPRPRPRPLASPMPYSQSPSTPQSASATLVSSSASRNSFTIGSTSFEGRRPTRVPRESQFVYKRGRKHHSYGSEKAPYPVTYDRDIIDVCVPLPSCSVFSV